MSEYPSGNALRDAGLIAVIKAAQEAGEPITPASISLNCRQRFNPSFADVTPGELAEALAFMAPPEAELEAGTVVGGQHLDEQPERDPPTMSRNQASLMVQDAQTNLLAARRELAEKVATQRAARAALSVAVMAWQRGGEPPPSREQLQRDYIRSEQARKLAGVSGRVMPTPGPSVIDQYAAAGVSGDASTFARKQMRFGSHHRPMFINGKWERPRQRGTKVPSER